MTTQFDLQIFNSPHYLSLQSSSEKISTFMKSSAGEYDLERATLALLEERMKIPFTIYICGDAGAGKTTLVKSLCGFAEAKWDDRVHRHKFASLRVEGLCVLDSPGRYSLSASGLDFVCDNEDEIDLVVCVSSAEAPLTINERRFLSHVSTKTSIPMLLLINKVDLYEREALESIRHGISSAIAGLDLDLTSALNIAARQAGSVKVLRKVLASRFNDKKLLHTKFTLWAEQLCTLASSCHALVSKKHDGALGVYNQSTLKANTLEKRVVGFEAAAREACERFEFFIEYQQVCYVSIARVLTLSNVIKSIFRGGFSGNFQKILCLPEIQFLSLNAFERAKSLIQEQEQDILHSLPEDTTLSQSAYVWGYEPSNFKGLTKQLSQRLRSIFWLSTLYLGGATLVSAFCFIMLSNQSPWLSLAFIVFIIGSTCMILKRLLLSEKKIVKKAIEYALEEEMHKSQEAVLELGQQRSAYFRDVLNEKFSEEIKGLAEEVAFLQERTREILEVEADLRVLKSTLGSSGPQVKTALAAD